MNDRPRGKEEGEYVGWPEKNVGQSGSQKEKSEINLVKGSGGGEAYPGGWQSGKG